MTLPSTHWSLLDAVRDAPTQAHRDALQSLAERYYYPALVHVRSRGTTPEDAGNLVQGFFENCLKYELFGRADRARGRFRNFFLTALDNYVRNRARFEGGGRRRPAGGFAELNEDLPAEDQGLDQAFYRAFAAQTIRQVLSEVETSCNREGQGQHLAVFRRRIVEPTLDGAEPPSEAELGRELGITAKQVANYVVTVKRIFRRYLHAHISAYAASPDDEAMEIKDMMGFLRWPE